MIKYKKDLFCYSGIFLNKNGKKNYSKYCAAAIQLSALRPSDGFAKKPRSGFFARGLAAAEDWRLPRP